MFTVYLDDDTLDWYITVKTLTMGSGRDYLWQHIQLTFAPPTLTTSIDFDLASSVGLTGSCGYKIEQWMQQRRASNQPSIRVSLGVNKPHVP
jgi:hypothetical protein